jgi:hypothetical protein
MASPFANAIDGFVDPFSDPSMLSLFPELGTLISAQDSSFPQSQPSQGLDAAETTHNAPTDHNGTVGFQTEAQQEVLAQLPNAAQSSLATQLETHWVSQAPDPIWVNNS